jgi:glucose/arabinose dehydrogenase
MVLFFNTALVTSPALAFSSTSATILHDEVMDVPTVNDDNLRVELVSSGLAFPTSMAFLGPEDILVLEKNNGTVQRIKNSEIFEKPVVDENVANEAERGMEGIFISEQNDHTDVFLYYTEAEREDGDRPIGNRLYKYQLVDGDLVNRQLLLDLPATPGPFHNGGALTVGPDDNIYLAIGDVDNVNAEENPNTLAENREKQLDGRGGILRVSKDGSPADTGILGNTYPLNYGDEINLVEPGFNSGWNRVQGLWEDNGGNMGETILSDPEGLVSFGGKGKYTPPELTWKNRVGLTALKFLDSERLGVEYRNDIFVSDYHEGKIYHFDLDRTRTELLLNKPLQDKVVDKMDEAEQQIFGQDFGGITNMEVGPDGYLYVLSVYSGKGALFKILPK